MQIFHVFGLDVKILIAQLLNFAILAFILFKFGYKPMFKFLEERSKKIEEGIDNANKAEQRLKEAAEKEAEILKEAKREASAILEEARKESEQNRNKAIEKAKEEIGQIINKEKQNMQLEKAEVLKSINREVADLVVAAVEKVIEEKMSGAKDEELIKKSIAKLK